MPSPFLKAEWRWLAMLNYEVDPAVLRPFVPAGTELDNYRGKTYVSVVGFQFLHTKLRGISVPFHADFEEVNLRFYVRRTVGNETRRGVVFIKEIVPKPAIAWVARWLYNENYVAMPMGHRVNWYGPSGKIIFEWKLEEQVNCLSLRADGDSRQAPEDSLEAFITEHYWGYARQRNGSTLEYKVEHPRWHIWQTREATLFCDVKALYGEEFVPFLSAKPASAFLAEGSEVTVFSGTRI